MSGSSLVLPDLSAVRSHLAAMRPDDARLGLVAARAQMEAILDALRQQGPPSPAERRELANALERFRAELAGASELLGAGIELLPGIREEAAPMSLYGANGAPWGDPGATIAIEA